MKVSRWLIVGAVIGAVFTVAAACDAETDEVNRCDWESAAYSRPRPPAPVKIPVVKPPATRDRMPSVKPQKTPARLPEVDVEYDCD